MDHRDVQDALREIADPEVAESSARFFKTGPENTVRETSFWGSGFPKCARSLENSTNYLLRKLSCFFIPTSTKSDFVH